MKHFLEAETFFPAAAPPQVGIEAGEVLLQPLSIVMLAGLDYKIMGRFFSGLAQVTGNWPSELKRFSQRYDCIRKRAWLALPGAKGILMSA